MTFFLQGLSHSGADLELWTLDLSELTEDSANENMHGQTECQSVLWMVIVSSGLRDHSERFTYCFLWTVYVTSP
jgi:hypothetical protein